MLRAVDGDAVYAHSVGGAEILDRPCGAFWAQLGVATRDTRILKHDVTVATASYLGPTWRQQQAFAGDHEQRLGAPSGAGLLDRSAHPLRVAEDHRVAGRRLRLVQAAPLAGRGAATGGADTCGGVGAADLAGEVLGVEYARALP